MKTTRHPISLALAAALIGAAILSAPQAQAGHDKAYIAAGALIGGVLGYLASDRDDHRDRVTVQVVHPRPRPVIVQHPRPVIVPRPVVVPRYRWQPREPVVVYHPKPCGKPTNTHHAVQQPARHGDDNRRPGSYSNNNRGRQGRDRR